MEGYRLVVEKSTVPVQTGEWIKRTMRRQGKEDRDFDVASNPEFLREGSAIRDFLRPDRIVIGVETERAERLLRELYEDFGAPILVTGIQSAELIKHASNSFLSMKISFINAIANICERIGADVTKVAEGVGLDHRIGKEFLAAGAGFGGFCFPKDLSAFIRIAQDVGYDFRLLREVEQINEDQKRIIAKKVQDALWIVKGKTIAVLGLAFKPNTDDLRYAPSLTIVGDLQREGARIKAYDPVAMLKARAIFTDVEFCADPYEAARDSDAVLLLTEWEEFRALDLERLKGLLRTPIFVDGRNVFEPSEMKRLGFDYRGVGR
jgi:UDPglucose 6-dehydrogenase